MEAPKIAPARAASFMAGMMVLASAMVGYLTITQWYGVGTPTMALVALALILGPLGAVLAATEIAGLKPRDVALPVAVNIALGVGIALVAGMPWRQAGVRAGLLSQGASLSAGRAAEFAMSDASDQVANQACRWIYKHGDVAQRRVTTERVARQPKRAAACLAQGDDARIVAARGQLVRTWAQALFASETSVDAVGSLTAALGAVASDDVAAAALLTCAVGHADAAYRPLCADALASAQLTGERLAEVLGRVDEVGLAGVWQPKIIAYAYHQYGLTPEDKQVAVKLGMLMPGMRRLALVRGCEVLEEDEMLNQLNATATASCDLKLKATDRDLWTSTCAQLTAREGAIGPKEMCAVLEDVVRLRAVEGTKEIVHAALNAADYERMSRQIDDAVRRRDKNAQQEFIDYVERKYPNAFRANGPLAAQYQILMMQGLRHGGGEGVANLQNAELMSQIELAAQLTGGKMTPEQAKAVEEFRAWQQAAASDKRTQEALKKSAEANDQMRDTMRKERMKGGSQ